MPIHDVGYRTWKGAVTGTWSRWWTISEVGIRTALSSRWIRRIILASWFPVIYFGIIFFVFETMMGSPILPQQEIVPGGVILPGEMGEQVNQTVDEIKQEVELGARKEFLKRNDMIQGLPNNEALIEALDSGDESMMRRTVWSYLLSTFLGYSQGMVTFMIIGLVVPPLISRDVRSRAFLLYYSRPITRMEYLLGKIAIPGVILSLVTLLPGFVLYFVALMASPDLSVVSDTWDLPIRVLLASVVCIVPTCLVGLLFSALTQESRFAGFAWFAIWGMGAVVWFVIYGAKTAENGGEPFVSNWSLISIYSTIGKVQSWIFGLEVNSAVVWPSLITLATISLVAFLLLYRRVSAPIRV